MRTNFRTTLLLGEVRAWKGVCHDLHGGTENHVCYAGIAGVSCAEELARLRPKDRITLVSASRSLRGVRGSVDGARADATRISCAIAGCKCRSRYRLVGEV